MAEIYGEKQIDRYAHGREIERLSHPELSDQELTTLAYKNMLINADYYTDRYARYADDSGIYGASYVTAMDLAIDRYVTAHPDATRIEASQDLTRYMADPENQKISRAEYEERRAQHQRPDRYRGGHENRRVPADGSNVMGPAPIVSNAEDHESCNCGDPNILKLSFEPGELAALRKNIRYLMRRWRR